MKQIFCIQSLQNVALQGRLGTIRCIFTSARCRMPKKKKDQKRIPPQCTGEIQRSSPGIIKYMLLFALEFSFRTNFILGAFPRL
jgi:hypothetical protein